MNYKIILSNELLEDLRYGKKYIDGKAVRAPMPIFAPFTPDYFLKGSIYLQPNSEQVLIAKQVKVSDGAFEILGELRFTNDPKNKKTETENHEFFLAHSSYEKLDDETFEIKGFEYSLYIPNVCGEPSIHRLFQPTLSNEEKKNKIDALSFLSKPLFPDSSPPWKYDRAKNVAHIVATEEILNQISASLREIGIPECFIQIGKTLGDKKPVLMIHNMHLIPLTLVNYEENQNELANR